MTENQTPDPKQKLAENLVAFLYQKFEDEMQDMSSDELAEYSRKVEIDNYPVSNLPNHVFTDFLTAGIRKEGEPICLIDLIWAIRKIVNSKNSQNKKYW